MTSIGTELPGTPLSEKDFTDKKILHNFDNLRGNFAWDKGVAVGKFLKGLKAGILLGSRCNTCRKTVIPPRSVCEWR